VLNQWPGFQRVPPVSGDSLLGYVRFSPADILPQAMFSARGGETFSGSAQVPRLRRLLGDEFIG